jgi:hypothetical protein
MKASYPIITSRMHPLSSPNNIPRMETFLHRGHGDVPRRVTGNNIRGDGTGGDKHGYYRIKDASACDVARAAGLLSSNTTVYAPNQVRIVRICDGCDDGGSDLAASQRMISLKEEASSDGDTINLIR